MACLGRKRGRRPAGTIWNGGSELDLGLLGLGQRIARRWVVADGLGEVWRVQAAKRGILLYWTAELDEAAASAGVVAARTEEEREARAAQERAYEAEPSIPIPW
jgi:hypothetical protein